jgi:acyl carrier protein
MEKFISLLCEILELRADALSPETELHKIKTWDSVAMVHFLAMADMEYHRNIIIEDLVAADTIKDLFTLTGS